MAKLLLQKTGQRWRFRQALDAKELERFESLRNSLSFLRPSLEILVSKSWSRNLGLEFLKRTKSETGSRPRVEAAGLPEPGRSFRCSLFASGAGVHVDFHAHRHLDNLRS